MQIKERGDVYQLLRYSGYSKEKKRATVEVAGSIAKDAKSIPDDLAAKLTPAEVEQLEAFLRKNAEDTEKRMAKYSLLSVPIVLSQAQKALENGEKPSDVDAIYDAMRVFKKAMKKAGFAPVRGEPEQGPGAPGQHGLALDDPQSATATTPDVVSE